MHKCFCRINDSLTGGHISFILAGKDSALKLADTIGVEDTLKIKDSLLVKDSLSIKDSARILSRIIIPRNQVPLEPVRGLSYTVSKREMLFNDYAFTGQLLDPAAFSFTRDLGTLGQPHEVTLYGAGYNELSFLKDGLFINNRLTNSLDLNNIQSESVDSVEVIPLPRGFLYGTFNNQSAVNFISREEFSLREKGAPYSRVRYYQAQNEEAMVDFIYNSHWFRRISTTFEITNKTYNDPKDPQPLNSDYSLWNANFRLKYFLSNSFNLIGSYNYVKSDIGLYGGITQHYLDSLRAGSQGSLDNLDLKVADVYFAKRHRRTTEHNAVLQLLGSPLSKNYLDIKAYYLFQRDSLTGTNNIFPRQQSKVYGAALRDKFDLSLFNFDLNSNYEVNSLKAENILKDNRNIHSFSLTAQTSLKLFDTSFVPSVFVKYLNYDGKSYAGFGGDVLYKYDSKIEFYAGLSQFKQPLNPVENSMALKQSGIDHKSISLAQAGVQYNYEGLRNSLSVFYRDIKNDPLAIMYADESAKAFNVKEVLYLNNKYWGIAANLNFRLWRIYLESNMSYYYNDRGNFVKYALPEFVLRTGIYYRDTLFNSSLHLKTGFYVQYTGTQNSYYYDFERQMRSVNLPDNSSLNNLNTVSPSLQLDFRLIGEIQKRAILYLAYENILDNRYYIIPNYFRPGRNFKIGISWEFLN